MKPPRIATRIVGATVGAVHSGRASGRRHPGFPQADRVAQDFPLDWFGKSDATFYLLPRPLLRRVVLHARAITAWQGAAPRSRSFRETAQATPVRRPPQRHSVTSVPPQ